jgi:hypothetical protein
MFCCSVFYNSNSSLINHHYHKNKITGLAYDIFQNFSLAIIGVAEFWAEPGAIYTAL